MVRLLLTALMLLSAYALPNESDNYADDHLVDINHRVHNWIDCETFFYHFDTLAIAAGVTPPTSVNGFNEYTCQKVFEHYQRTPKAVEAVVNLATHVSRDENGRRRLISKRDHIEDVASKIRRLHAEQVLTEELFEDMSPKDFIRDLNLFSNGYLEFDEGGSGKTQITNCEGNTCPHNACVPPYLFDSTFYEFSPVYGGGAGYNLGTWLIRERMAVVLGVVSAVTISPPLAVAAGMLAALGPDEFWSKEPESRTDTANTGWLEIAKYANHMAIVIQESICEGMPDDTEIILICIDLPSFFKVPCEIFELVLKISGAILDAISEQVGYQDGLVDGAEVEAAYENSRNLLWKHCAIFDQTRCRCQGEDAAGNFGMGCGKSLHAVCMFFSYLHLIVVFLRSL